MDPAKIHGKSLAMVAWAKTPEGEDDVVVFAGIADWDGKQLRMLRQGEPSFDVPQEFWERIQETNAEVRAIVLDAEYCFSVTVGDVKDGAGMTATGLKWPK